MGGTFQMEVSQIAFLILCSEPLARLVNSHSCNAQHIWKKHVFRSLAVNGEKRDFPSYSSDSEITPNGLCGPIIRDILGGAPRLETTAWDLSATSWGIST